jgi:hypothetical protein
MTSTREPSLDEAWRKAEAARPRWHVIQLLRVHEAHRIAWLAKAQGPENERGYPVQNAIGGTPIAALLGLAARLAAAHQEENKETT